MLLHIFQTTIIPILLMVFAGFFMDRKFHLDLPTLSKLNFYVVTPAFLLTNVYDAKLSMDSVHVLGVNILLMVITFYCCTLLIKGFSFEASKGEALRNAVLFNNCGNIGVPITTFIYSNSPFLGADDSMPYLQAALQVQLMSFMLINVTMNSFGFYYAGRGKLSALDAVRLVFRMPIVYAVIVALVLNLGQISVEGTFWWAGITYFSKAMVMVALFTLGVQLSRTPFDFFNRDVLVGVGGRLVGGPILAFLALLLYGVTIKGFTPLESQVIFISNAVPSGVMTALIAAEMRNHADYATQMVVASTVISALTLPVAIWCGYALFPL